MKKILIFHTSIPPYRIDLFNQLSQTFNLKVVITGSSKHIQKLGFDTYKIAEQALFTPEWHTQGIYLGNHLLSFIYFKRIITFRPDIVWCQELGINTLASILLKTFFNFKIVTFIDDSPAMLSQYSIVRKLLRKFVYKYIDTVFVVHKLVEEELKKLFPKTQFYYLPIIQNELSFKNKLISSSEIVKRNITKYNLSSKYVFLFVGRLEEVKQPQLLLQAFNKVQLSNCLLVFIGNGGLLEELKEYITNNKLDDKVLLLGKLEGKELYSWFWIADTLVLPSKYEPFGAVVNEALLAGCKVIISDKVGASTLVDSTNGSIFKYNEIDELGNLLKSYSKTDKKRIQAVKWP